MGVQAGSMSGWQGLGTEGSATAQSCLTFSVLRPDATEGGPFGSHMLVLHADRQEVSAIAV